jgi:hypothetical protein
MARVTREDFDGFMQALADAFNVKLGPGIRDVYYTHIAPKVADVGRLKKLARTVIEKEKIFPKIATILAYPELAPEDPTHKDPRQAFLDDDCPVVECVSGLVSYDDGYSTIAFRCPKCDRWPNTAFQRFRGKVRLRSEYEMELRRQERRELIAAQNFRAIDRMKADVAGMGRIDKS